MLERLKILILDDNQLDYELIYNHLLKSKYTFDCAYCKSKMEFEKILLEFKPTLILSDYNLLGYLGLDALEYAKIHCPDIPFIIVTGSLDEETAAGCIKSGAWDYVLKENLDRLIPAINSALNLYQVIQKNKEIESKLRKSEAYYRLMFESANDAIFLIKDNRIFDCNNRTEEIFDLNRNEIIGLFPYELSPEYQEDGISSIKEGKKLLQKTHEFGRYEFEWIHKKGDGTPFYSQISLNLIDFEGEEIVQALVRDIDSTKKTMLELEQSEQKLRLTIDSSPVGVCVTGLDGCLIESNKALCDMLKYSKEELLGRHFNSFTHPDDISYNSDLYAKLVSKKITSYDLEKRYICKDDSIIHVFIRSQVVMDKSGDPIFEIGIIENITKRKKAEIAYKESETKFKNFYDNANIGIYQTTPQGDIVLANPALVNMLGYDSLDELKQINLNKIGDNCSYNRANFLASFSKNDELIGLETMWPHKNGTCIYIRENARIIRNTMGEVVMFEGTAEDITENKLAIKALKNSESRFRSLYEYSPISILEEDFSGAYYYIQNIMNKGIKDLDKYFNEYPDEIKILSQLIKVINVNSTTLTLYDAATKKEVLHNIDSFLPDKAFKFLIPQFVAISKGEQTFQGELINITRTGREKNIFLQWDVQPGSKHDYSKVLVSIIDISQRKKIEQQLYERDEFSNALFMFTPVETIVVDKQGAVVRYNRSVEKLRRRIPQIGDLMYKDYGTNHSVNMYEVLQEALLTGETKIVPESKYYDIYLSITISPFEQGAIITAIDITNRKKAENQIKALNSVFENLGSNPDDNISYILAQTKTILFGKSAVYCKLTEDNNELEIQFNNGSPDFFKNQTNPAENFCFLATKNEKGNAVIIGDIEQSNFNYLTPLLSEHKINTMLGFPIMKDDNQIGSLCVFDNNERKFSNNDIYTISTLAKAISISEGRKTDKLSIMQSLHEKEILLKEIHHRVKNNIQIISSLLKLQSHHVENEEVLSVLKDSQSRVRAMALVHEKLYKSHDLSHIDINDYVQSLMVNLFSTLNVHSSLINFEIDIDKISLNIDTAIPLGLIISELFTNSIKYAFPETKKGLLKISLCKLEDKFSITVSDNGVGISKEIDPVNSTTLGLQLISALAKQLHGNFGFKVENGTEFTMVFKEK